MGARDEQDAGVGAGWPGLARRSHGGDDNRGDKSGKSRFVQNPLCPGAGKARMRF